jgi:hypothetical protein
MRLNNAPPGRWRMSFIIGLILVSYSHHSVTRSAVSTGITSDLFFHLWIENLNPPVDSKLALLAEALIIFLGLVPKIRDIAQPLRWTSPTTIASSTAPL